MGQNKSKAPQKADIQIVYLGRILNLYTVPKTFEELEAIAYNFYYSNVADLCPFEYLILTSVTRGFNKQVVTISSKSNYKSALKIVTKGVLQIEIQRKENERISTFKLKKIDDHAIRGVISKLQSEIQDSRECFTEVFTCYSKLLKISNHFSQFISAHETKSSLFALFSVIISDSFKSNYSERFTILDNWPYISFNAGLLSENSSNTLRVWNDFVFYLEKTIELTKKFIKDFENIASMVKSLISNTSNKERHRSSYNKILKFINTFKTIQKRLDVMHGNIKDFSITLKKDQNLSQMECVLNIISSCGAYGTENFMTLFGITPINKFYLN